MRRQTPSVSVRTVVLLPTMLVAAAAGPAGPAAAEVALEPPVTFGIGQFPADIAAVDLTGDGQPEIVSANFISSDLSILRNPGGGGFATPSTVPVGVVVRVVGHGPGCVVQRQ